MSCSVDWYVQLEEPMRWRLTKNRAVIHHHNAATYFKFMSGRPCDAAWVLAARSFFSRTLPFSALCLSGVGLLVFSSWNQNKNWMRLCLKGVSLRIGRWVFAVSKTEPFLFARTVVFLELRFLFLGKIFANLDIRVFKFSVDAFATFTASFSSSWRRFFSFTAEAFFARLDMTAVRKWKTKKLECCVLEASLVRVTEWATLSFPVGYSWFSPRRAGANAPRKLSIPRPLPPDTGGDLPELRHWVVSCLGVRKWLLSSRPPFPRSSWVSGALKRVRRSHVP